MSGKHQQRVNEVVAVLDEQREKIKRLHNDYYSAYDAAFDEHGAGASVQRWFDRTVKLIQEHVGQAEATKFQRALSTAPRGRGSWRFRELCQYFDTYLVRLIEDIEENPDDLNFDKMPQSATSQAKHATGAALQFDVFLSYSTQDKDEAREVASALAKIGKKCFIAEKSLQPGDKVQDEIRNALAGSNEIWILVSPNSIKSAWVQREVSAAWALEKRIVPILLRCAPGDLPEILADAHAIDYHKVHAYIDGLR